MVDSRVATVLRCVFPCLPVGVHDISTLRPPRYRIRFPAADHTLFEQGNSFFTTGANDHEKRIRFHDYAAIYAQPGLYEQLFYDRLKCASPHKLVSLLNRVVTNAGEAPSQLRVLDVGAGNGMVGELLLEQGTARVVGVDILADAALAAERDRPDVYDAYYVVDLTRDGDPILQELNSWNFDAMTCVAAIGFGDIPVAAFRTAYNLVANQGWIAFNIKETFLDRGDVSGFSQLIQRLIHDDYLRLHHLERYRHRLSIEGRPLHYYAVVGRKNRDLDVACLAGL
jgi:SAM-dependent methyltransferase